MKLLLILIFFCYHWANASLKDSTFNKKEKRYLIEMGSNLVCPLSANINYNFNNNFAYIPILTGMGISYQINDNNKISFNYNLYGNYFKYKKIGDVTEIGFLNTSFSLQKKLFHKKNFQYYQKLSLNYRIGLEEIFTGMYGWEAQLPISYYNSPGIGYGNEMNLKYGRRSYLGFDYCFYHFFEKSRLETKTTYPGHKPVRNLVICNLKIGFKL